MNTVWLKNNEKNKKLLVFFAGWSFDENPFKFLECKDFNVLFVYDYNSLETPEVFNTFKNYDEKILLTWSMGTYAAYKLRENFKDFDGKFVINGTVTPVDDNFGIPVKMFELTLKHAAIGLEGKFYKNVFKTEEELDKYLKTPVTRSIENRVNELDNLYSTIKSDNLPKEKFYDGALVSEFDKIIPPKNQLNSHKQNNTPVKTLPFGHCPFYNYESWNEIVDLCQSI